jgi:hypothetical protein
MSVKLTISNTHIVVSTELRLYDVVDFETEGDSVAGKEMWLNIADGRRPPAFQKQNLTEPEQLAVAGDIGFATVVLSTSACAGLFRIKSETVPIWVGLWNATDKKWMASGTTTMTWAPKPL